MPETKNLRNQSAAEKIREIAGDTRTCMFCCNLGTQPFDATPLAVQGVDEDGTIWFFSTKNSDRNRYLEADGASQLLFVNDGDSEYLSVSGNAVVMYDRQKVEELWSPMAKIWFQGGPTDPNLSLIRFAPSQGFYWDTQHGKMVQMAKMAASLVTGKTMDDSVDGSLKL